MNGTIIHTETIGQQTVELRHLGLSYIVTSFGQLGFKRYIKNNKIKAMNDYDTLEMSMADYYMGRDANDE